MTNSSSSSFIIRNTSNEDKTLVDFILENRWIYDEDDFYKDSFKFEDLVEDAKKHNITFYPGEDTEVECSDHTDESIVEAYMHNNLDKAGSALNLLDIMSQIGSVSISVLDDIQHTIKSSKSHSENFVWWFGENHH